MDKGRGAPGRMSRMLRAPGWDGCPAPTTRTNSQVPTGSSRYFHGAIPSQLSIPPRLYTTIFHGLILPWLYTFMALYTSTENLKNLSVQFIK